MGFNTITRFSNVKAVNVLMWSVWRAQQQQQQQQSSAGRVDAKKSLGITILETEAEGRG